MRKLFIVALLFAGTSAFALKDTEDRYGKSDVVIVAAECSNHGSSLLIMDEGERKRLDTDDAVCAELEQKFQAALQCNHVTADLTLSNGEHLFGMITTIKVIGIANAAGGRGPCL